MTIKKIPPVPPKKQSNKRKNPTENLDTKLYSQVDGICPKCSEVLMYEVNGRNFKNFEVAHIYPLNPTTDEKTLLDGQEKLNINVNHIDNLIALCGGCHGKFDKPRTVDGYKEMVSIKRRLIKEDKSRELWKTYFLEDEIIEVIAELTEDSSVEFMFNPSFSPKTINSKVNNTLLHPTKMAIKSNVAIYFSIVKEKFKQLDSLTPGISELISGQIKMFYLKNKQIENSQEFIYHSLVEWLFNKSKHKSKEASNIIISFFVQNCEVFE